MQQSVKPEIGKYMAPAEHRRNFNVFKGISQSPSVVEMSQAIGDKIGLPIKQAPINPNLISPVRKQFAKRGSYSLEQY